MMPSRFQDFGLVTPEASALDRLRGLAACFRDLDAMNDEPVRRGKDFNGFLASLLRADGIEAYEDQRGLDGRDEIDVAFSLQGRQFVLEAKWLAEKVNDDAVEKLRGRLKVRPPGTIGVFVSMNGYTEPALNKAKFFADVFLLDRRHIEALVTGLFTASELMGRVLSWANRRGGSHPPLDELLSGPPADASDWSPPENILDATPQPAGVSVTAVLAAPSGTALTGMTAHGDQLLLTTGEGVLQLDPSNGGVRWLLTLPGSRADALATATGTTVLCGAAALTHTGGEFAPVAGPFPSSAYLLADLDGVPWVFATDGPPGYGGRHTLTRLSNGPVEQREHTIDFVGKIDHMALLPGGRLYLVGGCRAGVLDIQETIPFPEKDWEEAPPLSEFGALLPRGAHTVLSAGRSPSGIGVEVYTTDLRTHQHTLLVTVPGQRAIGLAPQKGGGLSLMTDVWLPRSAVPRPVLFSLTLPEVDG